jgi:hypothetical protein
MGLYRTLFAAPIPKFVPGFECMDAEKMALLWPAGIDAARQVDLTLPYSISLRLFVDGLML